jgi:hypothetical protein
MSTAAVAVRRQPAAVQEFLSVPAVEDSHRSGINLPTPAGMAERTAAGEA